jgi:hypothetical protein
MGTDNLFHKRKAKSAKGLQRRTARRDPYAKVLIVCEGEKTEPHYFQDLRNHYGLNTANIEVCGECGSDPNSVLQFAKQRYREEKDAGDAFDQVFCVLDKDTHTNYDEALRAIATVTPRDTFIAMNSVPCFEYWLLLHYVYRAPGPIQHSRAIAQAIRCSLSSGAICLTMRKAQTISLPYCWINWSLPRTMPHDRYARRRPAGPTTRARESMSW